MSRNTKGARARQRQIGVPAAIIGSLAGVLAATPAMAAEPAAAGGAAPLPTAERIAPAAPSAPARYTVRSGDTVWGIAQRFGLRTADVLAWNGLTPASVIHPGEVLALSSGSPASAPAPAESTPQTHTVAAGDTVYAIAQRHGTSVAAVLAANGLSPASIIYPGQTLTIPTTGTLNSRQAENARMIIRIGRELGVSDRGIAIALATSMVEAWMRNLDGGDRDSLGLFQQRPSQGWGTPEQIRDRGYSIRAFYGGPADPNGARTRGLLDVPGWESMSFADAAQSVQISQYPERYGQWETQAYRWLEQYG